MNSHLFLQYGLRDLMVSSFPHAFWWIHYLPKYTQVLFLLLSDPSLRQFFYKTKQGKAGATDVSNFLRAFLMVSLNSLSSRVNVKDPSQFRAISRWSFSFDHFCFSFSLACFPIDFQSSGHRWSGLVVGCLLFNLSPDHIFCQEAFFQWNKLCESWPRIRQVSRPIRYSNNHRCVSLCFTSKFVWVVLENVNVHQWNREWFFSRRVKFDSGFNVMAVYEASCHQKSFIASPAFRKWVLRLWKRPFWFSKKVNIALSLIRSMPYQGWMFSVPDLLQGFWFVHLRLEK